MDIHVTTLLIGSFARSSRNLRFAALSTCFLALGVGNAQTTVTIGALKDNTLYESTTGTISNGAGEHFFVGRTNQTAPSSATRRGVIAFDVAGNVPAGATITAVTLTLNMSQSKTTAGQSIELHRALKTWGEGTSNAAANEGSGAVATTGDATWLHTFFDTSLWDKVGGDFSAVISASKSVGATGSYTWTSTAQLVNDVQGWLNTPGSNFGWVLVGDEITASSSKRFDSRENATASLRPALSITFTPPALSATPKIISFGNVPLGSFKDTTVTITDNGANALNITSIVSSGNPFSVRISSASLTPGQSLVDTLRFTPAALGPASAKIVLTSNSTSSPDTIQVSGSGIGIAVLQLSTHSISFGNVKVGQSKDTTVIITNNGSDTLKITNVSSGSVVFSARPSECTLLPGQLFADTLSFSPSSTGPVQASILLVSNSGTSPDTVKVDGSGQPVTGVAISQTGVPDQFGLSQNYPNPFNPSTMIRYALPYRSTVRIRVFNVLGQMIAELVSGEQGAGYREVVWNASVSSGLYFYRIEAVSVADPTVKFVDVKKMLLLK